MSQYVVVPVKAMHSQWNHLDLFVFDHYFDYDMHQLVAIEIATAVVVVDCCSCNLPFPVD